VAVAQKNRRSARGEANGGRGKGKVAMAGGTLSYSIDPARAYAPRVNESVVVAKEKELRRRRRGGGGVRHADLRVKFRRGETSALKDNALPAR
jgi:hypothetical protein